MSGPGSAKQLLLLACWRPWPKAVSFLPSSGRLNSLQVCEKISPGPTGLLAPKSGIFHNLQTQRWLPSDLFVKGLVSIPPLPLAHIYPPTSRRAASLLLPAPGPAGLAMAFQLRARRSPQSPPSQTMATRLLPRPSQALLEGDKQPSPQRQAALPIKR